MGWCLFANRKVGITQSGNVSFPGRPKFQNTYIKTADEKKKEITKSFVFNPNWILPSPPLKKNEKEPLFLPLTGE